MKAPYGACSYQMHRYINFNICFSYSLPVRMWDIRPFAPLERCLKVFTGAQHNFEKVLLCYNIIVKQMQWNPDFSNLLGKSKLVQIIKGFKKPWVKLQCLTGEGKSGLVRIIRSFKKPRGSRNRDSTVL